MSIKKSISFTFIAQIVNTIIAFITSIILTRFLGVSGRGDYAIFINSIAFVVLFFGFSVNSTIPYFINSGKAKAGELLSTIISFAIVSTIIVFATLQLLFYNNKLGLALPSTVQSVDFRVMFCIIYFTNLCSSVLTSFLLAFQKFKQVSIYSMAFQLIPALIYLGLYEFNKDAAEPFKAVVITSFVVAILAFVTIAYMFTRILKINPARKIIPVSLIRQFVLFSSMAYIGNVATFFNYKLDFWVIDNYWGKNELGIYSLASQLSQLLWILPMAIAQVLYSFASKCTEEQAVDYAIKLKQIAFYGTLVLAIAGSVLAYYFIPVLYGVEFTKAFDLMKIFMIGVIPFSIPTVLASLYAAMGNFKISFVISIMVFIISVACYFILIPKFGSTGGAVASAISYLSGSVICEIWFCRRYKQSIFNLFRIDFRALKLRNLTGFFK